MSGGKRFARLAAKPSKRGSSHELNPEESDGRVLSRRNGGRRPAACDICRERKVKCDGTQPTCSRCARLQKQCSYTNLPSLNVSHEIMILRRRLAETESRLTLHEQLPTTSYQRPSVQPPLSIACLPTCANALDYGESELNLCPGCSAPTGNDADISRLADFDFPHLELPEIPDLNSLDQQTIDQKSSRVYQTTPERHMEIDPKTLETLALEYFQFAHPTFSFVNQQRFMEEKTLFWSYPKIRSLSYSLALVAASTSADYKNILPVIYDHARSTLEEAERDDNIHSYVSIQSLQSLLLITWYELLYKPPMASWITLGRALRLIDALGLKNTGEISTQAASANIEPHCRRSLLWTAVVFEFYSSLTMKYKPALLQETKVTTDIATYISIVSEKGTSNSPGVAPRISNLAEKSLDTPILVISSAIAYLFSRCVVVSRIEHREGGSPLQSQNNNPDIWLEVYDIDKSITNLSVYISAEWQDGVGFGTLPEHVVMKMSVSALTIFLHEQTQFHGIQFSDQSEDVCGQCNYAAREISTLARRILEAREGSELRQYRSAGFIVLLPLFQAARTLHNLLQTPQSYDKSNCIEPLDTLLSCMSVIGGSVGIWNGFVEEIRAGIGKYAPSG